MTSTRCRRRWHACSRCDDDNPYEKQNPPPLVSAFNNPHNYLFVGSCPRHHGASEHLIPRAIPEEDTGPRSRANKITKNSAMAWPRHPPRSHPHPHPPCVLTTPHPSHTPLLITRFGSLFALFLAFVAQTAPFVAKQSAGRRVRGARDGRGMQGER